MWNSLTFKTKSFLPRNIPISQSRWWSSWSHTTDRFPRIIARARL